MRSSWGRQITYSLFGESHGEGIGITLHHLPAGFRPDFQQVRAMLDRRRPGTGVHATPRQEADDYRVLSGLNDGVLTGAPLTVFFENTDTRSRDYQNLANTPRPSHADYAATVKYEGCHDYRGGGHFSGRLTAPVVFAGALALQLLERHGVAVGSRISRLGDVTDAPAALTPAAVAAVAGGVLKDRPLPFLSPEAAQGAEALLAALKADGDSCGAQVEICAVGVPAGWGEPVFDALESTLAHLYFAIPGVKAVEFGEGTGFSALKGSEANDPWVMDQGRVASATNRSGGINGGISNGMPVLARLTFRPTPSIALQQQSVDLAAGTDARLSITGRHDPCIAVRACPVAEAVTAMGLLDALLDQQIQRQEVWK